MIRSRARASLLWWLVGALSFLVLVQGYRLVARPSLDPVVTAAVALVVGVAATGLTYAGRRWLEARAP